MLITSKTDTFVKFDNGQLIFKSELREFMMKREMSLDTISQMLENERAMIAVANLFPFYHETGRLDIVPQNPIKWVEVNGKDVTVQFAEVKKWVEMYRLYDIVDRINFLWINEREVSYNEAVDLVTNDYFNTELLRIYLIWNV